MAEGTRKSSYEGDQFGDWVVLERITERKEGFVKGKRYWLVKNEVTNELRDVEQTALKLLPKEDAVAPVKLVANGANWAFDIPVAGCESPLCCAPEDEDYHVGEAPEIHGLVKECGEVLGVVEYQMPNAPTHKELEAVMAALHATGYVGELNADGKIPGNNKGDLNLKPDWAEKAVELHTGPKLDGPNPHRHPGTIHTPGALRTSLGFTADDAGWAADLPVAEDEPTAMADFGVTVEKFGGIGEAAETTVTEAELDGRVPAPDPIRTAVRRLVGEIFTLHEQRVALEEQLQEMANQLEGVRSLCDTLLREVIVR